MALLLHLRCMLQQYASNLQSSRPHHVTADGTLIKPQALEVCKCSTCIALARTFQITSYVSALLHWNILPLHVPCVHLRTTSRHNMKEAQHNGGILMLQLSAERRQQQTASSLARNWVA